MPHAAPPLPKTLLITPPFTQLNTPYPATAYLKGFLNTIGAPAAQADLGLEVVLALFSRKGLQQAFDYLDAQETDIELSPNAYRIYSLRRHYLQTIDPTIRFLQHADPTLAHSICGRDFLPEASRFDQIEDLEWAFGTLGLHDQARHLATLYLEDLGDFIQEAIDPHFGFSRYAERLGRTATSLDPLLQALGEPPTLVRRLLLQCLEAHLQAERPDLVCLTVPFPGNLFGALCCAQHIRRQHPHIRIALGGGFANTELRSLSDPRFFDLIDFVTLDDGEAPLAALLQHLAGNLPAEQLKRTFCLQNGHVQYANASPLPDVPQKDVGTPDYRGLPLRQYLSVIEVANPMHRLWSDGRWNKLTMAHGCYWAKCSFCDVSLDYIRRYEPVVAATLCDRMETLMAETGESGFHFVDEAAPPALMRDLALEILRRGLSVSWWTNIRFEERFTPDLCRLLKASGCVAVSGGLEVASDRLLALMEKGVTVAQVARVAQAFADAGIMVHAYLMYGFPTQTAQETIDSLEMVRQLFEEGVLQSGFWHQFAMTAHSPVGLRPERYRVQPAGPAFEGFADNDRYHHDPEGAEHERFSEGLRKSLFNYMHGVGFDLPLSDWFEHRVPRTKVPKHYIAQALAASPPPPPANAMLVWLGDVPELEEGEWEDRRGNRMKQAVFACWRKKGEWVLETDWEAGLWLQEWWPRLGIGPHAPVRLKEWAGSLPERLGTFEHFQRTPLWEALRANGLLVV